MRVLFQFIRICLVGLWHRQVGRRSPDWAACRELWGPPDHPLAAKPTVYRTIQLSWRALRLILIGEAKDARPKGTRVLILWCGGEPDPARYVRDYCGESEITFVHQLACPSYLSVPARLAGAAFLLCWCGLALPIPLLTRTNSAFERIVEVARAFLVLGAVRHLAPERVFFYSSYQRYANLVSLMIARLSGAKVTRIPSPNPLHFHYGTCVSDEFVLTSALQIPEYRRLREGWFVSRLNHWRPTGFADIPEVSYQLAPAGKKTIGVLSGGQWRRYERGDYYDEERLKHLEAEKQLHLLVGEYVREHSDVDVLVYPHPSEKSDAEVYARACRLYQERIGDERVAIVPAGQRTHERFRDTNTLVSLWSTSAIDAIYCGHKVLFAQLGCPALTEGSALDNVHAHDAEELKKSIGEVLRCPTEEYFRNNDLLPFRHDYFDSGPIPVSVEATADKAGPVAAGKKRPISAI